MDTSLTSKGQITIPIIYRQALELETGDRIVFEQVEDCLILRKRESDITASFGLIKASRGVSLTGIEKAIIESTGEHSDEND